MLSSLAVALTLCLFAWAIIVVALSARARTTDAIAGVQYNAERPAKTR